MESRTLPLSPRSLLCSAIAFGVFLSTAASSAEASNEWAVLLTSPFVAQIANTLDGKSLAPTPEPNGATLSTVVGISVGQAIVVDTEVSQGTVSPVLTQVTSIGDQTLGPNWVTWSPALPGKPALNGFVRAGTIDGTSASVFALQYPKQSAVDSAGRIYTVDTFNHRIAAIDGSGRPLWTLGSHARIYSDDRLPEEDRWGDCDNAPVADCPNDPKAMLGGFFAPLGIDVSEDGRTLVVSDTYNHRLQIFTQVSSGGSVAAIAANGGSAPQFQVAEVGGIGSGIGQFNAPAGVSLDARGRIAVADEYNHRIQVLTPLAPGAPIPAGTTVVTASNGIRYSTFAFGQFGSPDVVDPNDIRFFDPEDVEFDRSRNADGSATATNGRIVVADADNNRIQIFDASGAFISVIGSDVVASSEPGDFDAPLGVTVDGSGRIYVVDTHNSRIQVFALSGATSYALQEIFGTEQTAGIPGMLPLLGPTGIAVGSNRLIITEQSGSRLQVLARAVISIDSLTTQPAAPETLVINDPARDHIHVGVTVHNTGPIGLRGISLAVAASHLGRFISSITPASIDLASGGAARFDFDYQVTGLDGGLPTLRFNVSAAATAGEVKTNTSAALDTQVTVQPPNEAAVTLGQLVATPSRVGANDAIHITVPVQNIGNSALSAVAINVSSSSGTRSLVAPVNASTTVTSLAAHATTNVEFVFAAQQVGDVVFTASVGQGSTGVGALELYEHPANAAIAVHISDDALPPQVLAWTTPSPASMSADAKRWFNASIGWPTVTVTARDNVSVKKLGWYMVNTSGQVQSDQVGYCSATGASISPNPCTVGPDGMLTWRRTLTNMHRRIVIAVWAEDDNGNGAATTPDLFACNQVSDADVVRSIGSVTCVSLHVDIDPPVVYQGQITFDADNTAARIPFTTGDVNSGVKGISSLGLSAPNDMIGRSTTSGELVLRSEGIAVAGQVVVTDYANNSVARMLPTGTLRLDRTPPEAFNRLDVSALGRSCTTVIDGKPTSYFCSNKVYGTDNLPGLSTSAQAPVGVQQVQWANGDDDDHDKDGALAELHTYSFTDAYVPTSGPAPSQNPNQVTLVEKVEQSASEARITVVSYQYRRGTVVQPVIVPDWATKKYDWSLNGDGSLQSLTQKFELHKGKDKIRVQATFDAKSGVTTIKEPGSGPKRVVTGLILLKMTTANGELVIDYDVNAPVTR